MPAMHFVVCWPDGSKETCYSPSTAIEKYLLVNHPYALNEFVQVTTRALDEASERVNAKFGYYCSSAQDQSAAIVQKAAQFSPEQRVTVEKIPLQPDVNRENDEYELLSCRHYWRRSGRSCHELEPDAKKHPSYCAGTPSSGLGLAGAALG